MMKAKFVKGLIAILALSTACVCWGSTPPPVVFRGQATAVDATVLGINTVLGDTGALAKTGGVLQNNLATVNIPLVLSGVIAHGEVVGIGDHTEASSSVVGLNVLCGGILLTADLLQSRAYVTGSGNGAPTETGSSVLANLVVAGQKIVVSGKPNQTIKLPGAKLIINQQTQGEGKITVIALHLEVTGIADLQLAAATAGIGPCSGCTHTCSGTPNCTGALDILSGSGSLLNDLNGVVQFGLELNNGSNWGGFLFNDAEQLVDFQATSLTSYVVVNANERQVSGVGKLNGLFNVNYVLDIVANGDQTSTFTLSLSSGYKITGTLNLGFLEVQQACNN